VGVLPLAVDAPRRRRPQTNMERISMLVLPTGMEGREGKGRDYIYIARERGEFDQCE
jgi:hypothetical protein